MLTQIDANKYTCTCTCTCTCVLLLTDLVPVFPLSVIPTVGVSPPHTCSPISPCQSLNSVEREREAYMCTCTFVYVHVHMYMYMYKSLDL